MHFIDASDTYVECVGSPEKAIAAIGVQNLAIIDTPDALLIADRQQSQKVSAMAKTWEQNKGYGFSKTNAVVEKPWGNYLTLRSEIGYQVKRLLVKKGQKLSLQYHNHRAEHWIVVHGRAIVQIGDRELVTEHGEYRYIPLGEKHRLTNIGEDDLMLIEIQVGDYLGEDDIVRLEDKYGRETQ